MMLRLVGVPQRAYGRPKRFGELGQDSCVKRVSLGKPPGGVGEVTSG